ncbi:MAG TPA: adenosylcobinamide amidohydrolase, partial [Clostridium sp.]|nr:adenosylcobinamide amidohydrolase [Clostridium sp.]
KDDRKVLSTSPINGGYREDLKTVFNHDENPGAGIACKLKAPTYSEHMYLIAEQLGLNSEETAGISTAASMENLSIKSESFDEVTVTAMVTGGVEVNGGRVGD